MQRTSTKVFCRLSRLAPGSPDTTFPAILTCRRAEGPGAPSRAASRAAQDAEQDESGPTGPLIGTRDDPSTGAPIVVSVTEEKKHAAAAHDDYKHFMKTHTIHYEQPGKVSRSRGDVKQDPSPADRPASSKRS